MVLLGVELAARETDEFLCLVDVIPVVAVILDLKRGTVVLLEELCVGLLDAREEYGAALFFKIRENLRRRLRPLLLCTERLDGHELAFPLARHVEHIAILCPSDMVRLAPHEEVREIEVGILVIAAGKMTVQHRLVFFRQILEIDDSHPPDARRWVPNETDAERARHLLRILLQLYIISTLSNRVCD